VGRVPGPREVRHSVGAGCSIAALPKPERIAAILGINAPTPCSVARRRSTRHAVEDAAYLNAIPQHDEVVRRPVGRIGLENERQGQASDTSF
jgi:hypothetical protein